MHAQANPYTDGGRGGPALLSAPRGFPQFFAPPNYLRENFKDVWLVSLKARIIVRFEDTNTLAQRLFLSPLLILGEGEGEVTRFGH